MNIIIKRYCIRPDTIDGHLLIDGDHICDTAENAQTAIKAGTYPIVITKCHQHSRKMPVVCLEGSTLPQCSQCESLECVSYNSTMPQICHMLKPGNGVYKRTDGSIILGKFLVPGCLTQPKQAFDDFYERIRKSIERGHELTITIIEDYPPPPSAKLTNYQMGLQILRQF